VIESSLMQIIILRSKDGNFEKLKTKVSSMPLREETGNNLQ